MRRLLGYIHSRADVARREPPQIPSSIDIPPAAMLRNLSSSLRPLPLHHLQHKPPTSAPPSPPLAPEDSRDRFVNTTSTISTRLHRLYRSPLEIPPCTNTNLPTSCIMRISTNRVPLNQPKPSKQARHVLLTRARHLTFLRKKRQKPYMNNPTPSLQNSAGSIWPSDAMSSLKPNQFGSKHSHGLHEATLERNTQISPSEASPDQPCRQLRMLRN